MAENKEKCINPWFGFLVIVVVCILIASAIFFEFNGGLRHGKARTRQAPNQAAGRAALPVPGAEVPATRDKLLF